MIVIITQLIELHTLQKVRKRIHYRYKAFKHSFYENSFVPFQRILSSQRNHKKKLLDVIFWFRFKLRCGNFGIFSHLLWTSIRRRRKTFFKLRVFKNKTARAWCCWYFIATRLLLLSYGVITYIYKIHVEEIEKNLLKKL